MFYKPPKYLIHFFFTFTPGKDESTSESENKGDSSDSSEDAPEQHQVRTIQIF